MNYLDLNRLNKVRMLGTINSPICFSWEDEPFINILLGELPPVKINSDKERKSNSISKLKDIYNGYSFLHSDRIKFINEIKEMLSKVRDDFPYWAGINLYETEEAIKAHKFCLISGEGGIGKSYFIKVLEEELEKKGTKHLCVYGKFTKNISDIDFNEIVQLATDEEFVFIFDAINEINDYNQNSLLIKLNEIKDTPGLRIILTYRTRTVSEQIISKYKKMCETEYHFPGVSFESALDWLLQIPILNITEYQDVLYSNNPFLLGKLEFILSNSTQEEWTLNNISRYTYIYEKYIKLSLDIETWRKTKKVSSYMYEHNTKSILLDDLSGIINSYDSYLEKMEQQGFITRFVYQENEYMSFSIDSLADYLLARNMLEELSRKSIEEAIAIIKEKIKKIPSIYEVVIILLFDKYSPNYQTINKILHEAELIEDFSLEILSKIHFKPEHIPEFLNTFKTNISSDLLMYFGGYINKPFNCVNYLNSLLFQNEQEQMELLTKTLSRRYLKADLHIRIKNLLYYTCKCPCDEERALEIYYTALWCSASGNQKLRNLSKKLLYETIHRHKNLINISIKDFYAIKDYYIQDSIIHALSSCESSPAIIDFFEKLLNEPNFILSKSIERISNYLSKPYKYIECSKINLYSDSNDVLSSEYTNFLHSIDLYEKELLPFRFWGINSINATSKFLSVDKQEILDFNTLIEKDFGCVKSGICSGMFSLRSSIEDYYGISYRDRTLNGTSFLSSLDHVFKNTFLEYGLSESYDTNLHNHLNDFENSPLRKCICVAIEKYYGSIMCNYFSIEFGSFNTSQNSIGYEPYSTLEYGEDLHLCTPLSVYQPIVEKMGDLTLAQLDFSSTKNIAWWNNLENTKNNLLSLLSPIIYASNEWILLSARVSMQGLENGTEWKETYSVYACARSDETIRNHENARLLSIELDNYSSNIKEYSACKNKPWLCKTIPSIMYNSSQFEDVNLVFPPASIISYLGLKLNEEKMHWENEANEPIIICNNNKSSYYTDSIMGTSYIRKDIYDKLIAAIPIKYFAFSEKYLSPYGYSDESACHFEIVSGQIVEEVLNAHSRSFAENDVIPEECKHCKFDFYKENPDDKIELETPIRKFLKEYGQ